ncbi:MAG: threonine/serine exporter family protein [Planctomycetes bacterium]|nr:threonine/serine exporter family protein [Planctomycetota bacterium]
MNETQGKDVGSLLQFMCKLGQAYIGCGEQTAQVELLLRRIASANGMVKARVVAFPSALFIFVNDGEKDHVTLIEGPLSGLRLDQIADVYTLGGMAGRGELAPRDGLKQLAAIMHKTPRFGVLGSIVGHTILTVGIAMMFMPALSNIATAACLGLVIGLIKAVVRQGALLAVPMSVVAAAVVSSLVVLASRYGYPVDPLHALIPPLITFLPGGMLTLGMLELAYGDMVSGASRLIGGFVQLVLLAFGLAAGAAIMGVTPGNMFTYADFPTIVPWAFWAAWAPWAGVIVFGIGVFLHFSAPRNSLLWMLLVLLVTFATQQIATKFIGSEFSGFFGMLVATPLGYLIRFAFKGPPSMVTFLPSFWLLVPGALGLLSVKRMLSDRVAGIDGLITAVFVFASIALGTLMGASLYKGITERFGWWQLKVGRAPRENRMRQLAAAIATPKDDANKAPPSGGAPKDAN